MVQVVVAWHNIAAKVGNHLESQTEAIVPSGKSESEFAFVFHVEQFPPRPQLGKPPDLD